MRLKDFSKLYFVLLLAHLAALDVGESIALIRFTKPLLLLGLIAFFVSTVPIKTKGANWFIAGLVFSLVGDVCLMFDANELFFFAGLGGFLLAHVFYLLSFKSILKSQKPVAKITWLIMLIPILYGIGLFKYLLPLPAVFVYPVLIYAAILVAMAGVASVIGLHVKTKYAAILVLGAVFFVLSDSLLALRKFADWDFGHIHVAIMFTYGVSQFALVVGAVYLLPQNRN